MLQKCQFQHSDDDSIDENNIEDQTGVEENIDVVVNDLDSRESVKAQTTDKESIIRIIVEKVDNESYSDSEAEEVEDLECYGRVSENVDLYIEHRGMGGCAFFCYHCEKTYRNEVDLKAHLEKHCSKCGVEYSTAKALKLHMKKC